MAIFANSSTSAGGSGDTSANFSAGAVLLRFILDLVKEQRHQSETLIGRDQVIATNTSATPDADQEWMAQHLLMPIWAYQSAAAYLIFISVLGLFMNIVVVLVIINDPQVGLHVDSSSLLNHI
jgi:hypothetical protein